LLNKRKDLLETTLALISKQR